MRSKLCITVWSYHNKCMSHGSCVSTLEGHNGVWDWDGWDWGVLSPGLDTPRHTSTHLDTGLDTLDTPFPDSMLRRCRGYSLDTLDTLDTLDSGSTALDSTSTVLSSLDSGSQGRCPF